MLSFTRRSKCQFEGEATVPAELLTGRPTNSYDVATTVAIPKNVQRRERYLMSLAVDYLCRWSVSMPPHETFGDEEIETNAFYAAISQADVARRKRLVGATEIDSNEVDEQLERQMAKYNMVLPLTECATSLLHDWSLDTIRKNYFNSQNRVCINVHYAHVCAKHGRELLELSNEEAEKHNCEAGKPAPIAFDPGYSDSDKTLHSSLFAEMLAKHEELRSVSSPEKVAAKIEKTDAERREKSKRKAKEAQLKLAQEEAALMEANRRACDKMIAKAQPKNALAELQARRAMSTGDRLTRSESDSEIVGKAADSDGDDDDSSATFSDEEPIVKRSYIDVALGRAATGVAVVVSPRESDSGTGSCDDDEEQKKEEEEDNTANENTESSTPNKDSSGASSTGGNAGEEPLAQTKQQEEEEDDDDDNDDKEEKGAPASQVKLGHAIRQTSFEAMIRVCESTDSIASFDQKGSPFVFQWAKRAVGESGARSKLHLFRKQTVSEPVYFGLSSTEKSVFHLIASIEIICDN